MSRLVKILTLVTCVYTLDASALIQRCEMDYAMAGPALIVQFGAGNGMLTCWDAVGHGYQIPVNVGMGGVGLKAGICQAQGHISSVGPGFALNNIFAVMAKAEAGPMVPGGCSVGVGAKANIAGLSAEGTINQTCYGPAPCAGLIDGEGLLITPAAANWNRCDFNQTRHAPGHVGCAARPVEGSYHQAHWITGGYDREGRYHEGHWDFSKVAAGKPQPIDPNAPVRTAGGQGASVAN